jgi:serine/threonine protein kinase
MISDVIGEGTYGCVHKPSLKCKNKEVKYTDKISKLLDSKEARKELKEYKVIGKIDNKRKIYLGKPIQCKVDDENTMNRIAVNKCKNGKKLMDKMDELSLLVMKDGGVNLETYGEMMKTMKNTPKNRETIEKFWIEVHRIFYGLSLFQQNDVIHHDLKPQNIVYNEEENRLNFIDFGLMRNKKEVIEKSRNNENGFGIKHWSFPMESVFYNEKYFTRFTNSSEERKINYYEYFLGDVKLNENVETFLYYTIQGSNTLKDRFILDLYQFMVNEIKDMSYDDFLEQSLDTIDIYGVGIAMFYLISHCRLLLDTEFYRSLRELFYRMITPDLTKRITVDQLLDEYEIILSTHGFLEKHHYYFSNHLLKTGSRIPTVVKDKMSSIQISSLSLSPDTIKENANRTPVRLCPEGKEPNPSTNRCVKRCKEGKHRNEKFRCVKDKSVKKYNATKTAKMCPEGKVLNPKTNRCNKVKTRKIRKN